MKELYALVLYELYRTFILHFEHMAQGLLQCTPRDPTSKGPDSPNKPVA